MTFRMKFRRNRLDETGSRRRGSTLGSLGSAVTLLAAVGVAGTASRVAGQEADSTPVAARPDQETPPPPRFVQDLELSQEQADAVRAVLDDLRDHRTEPGATWRAAAELQGILDSGQIATLAEHIGRPMPGDGRRGRAYGPDLRRSGSPRGQQSRRPDGLRGAGGAWGLETLENLDLTDEQRSELKQIRESFAPQVRDVRSSVRDGILSPDEAEARLESVRDSIHEAILGVLTAEQKAVLEQHRAEAEARREAAEARREEARLSREARRDSMLAVRSERMEAERRAMIEVLGLSDSQAAALDSLRPERPGPGGPPPEDVAALRAERQAAIAGILDESQEETWILHQALVGMAMRDRR